MYAFAKNQKSNISDEEKTVLKVLAKEFLAATPKGIKKLKEQGVKKPSGPARRLIDLVDRKDMPGDKLSGELVKIRPDIPILLCTGFSETMSEEKAASLGIKGFLLKPIVMKDLSHKIREVLEESQQPLS